MSTTNYDIIIVGGGIVGLATAYKLTQQHPNKTILVLEKEKEVAAHQTGHNSGVIHSGIYYKPVSYKAINCVAGRRELISFVKEHNIPHDICGKIEAKRYSSNPSIGLVFVDEIGIGLLIKMSGGNRRILCRLLRDLFAHVEHLPVTDRYVNRVISEARNVAHRTVDEKDWELLAKVHLNPLAPYDLAAEYQSLIRSKSMLYYTGFPCYWLVNPLIEKLHPFQEALQKIQ